MQIGRKIMRFDADSCDIWKILASNCFCPGFEITLPSILDDQAIGKYESSD
jgi:hypothetical protein